MLISKDADAPAAFSSLAFTSAGYAELRTPTKLPRPKPLALDCARPAPPILGPRVTDGLLAAVSPDTPGFTTDGRHLAGAGLDGVTTSATLRAISERPRIG